MYTHTTHCVKPMQKRNAMNMCVEKESPVGVRAQQNVKKLLTHTATPTTKPGSYVFSKYPAKGPPRERDKYTIPPSKPCVPLRMPKACASCSSNAGTAPASRYMNTFAAKRYEKR
jgi:hypothetical protein